MEDRRPPDPAPDPAPMDQDTMAEAGTVWSRKGGASLFRPPQSRKGGASLSRPPQKVPRNPRRLTMIHFSNTVIIDLKQAATAFGKTDWVDFLITDLNIKAGDLSGAYLHSVVNRLLVTFNREEQYMDVALKLHEGVKWTKKNNVVVYGFPSDEDIQTYRLSNIPGWIRKEQIEELFATKGEVVFAKAGQLEELGCSDGCMEIRMRLDKGKKIPYFLPLDNGNGENRDVIQIYSDDMEKCCFKCLEPGHVYRNCRNKTVQFDCTLPWNKEPAKKTTFKQRDKITADDQPATTAAADPPLATADGTTTADDQPATAAAADPPLPAVEADPPPPPADVI